MLVFTSCVDAHSFEPSTKDMVSLAESDLFIYFFIFLFIYLFTLVWAWKNIDLIETALNQ